MNAVYVVGQVRTAFERSDKYASLVGEIIATIELNLDRGHIFCTHREELQKIIDNWKATMVRIAGKSDECSVVGDCEKLG